MKKILFVIMVLSIGQLTFAQSLEMPEIKVEPIFKGEYRIITSETRSIPPNYSYKVMGYNYEIRMQLKFKQDVSDLESLYGIVYRLPSGEIIKSSFKSDSLKRIDSTEYEYFFPVRIKQKGWFTIFVVDKNEFKNDLGVGIYDRISNKAVIYLDKK